MVTFISKLALGMANLKIKRRLDAEEMNRGMLEAGLSQRHVTGVLSVSKSTVARMWEQFRTHGNVWHRHGDGRERVTTHRQPSATSTLCYCYRPAD